MIVTMGIRTSTPTVTHVTDDGQHEMQPVAWLASDDPFERVPTPIAWACPEDDTTFTEDEQVLLFLKGEIPSTTKEAAA